MLQAYRAGLLEPAYKFKWTSRIRENWMLDAIQRENDARQGLHVLGIRSAFATLFEDPNTTLQDMLKRAGALSGYRESNPVALLGLDTTQERQMLQELWRAMKQQGMLDPRTPP